MDMNIQPAIIISPEEYTTFGMTARLKTLYEAGYTVMRIREATVRRWRIPGISSGKSERYPEETDRRL